MSAGSTSPDKRGILALGPVIAADEQFLAALRQFGVIRIVDSVEDALAALRADQFEVVLSRPMDLFPLARAEARQRGELILDKIGQGVCVVCRDGAMSWANPKLESYPAEVREAIRANCAELCQQLAAERPAHEPAPSRRRTVHVGSEYVFDLTVSPLLAPEKELTEVVGLVWDISAAHRMQERINAIDAAGRELMRLDVDALMRLDAVDRLQFLEEQIVRSARELLRFDHFVVRLLDHKSNRLETVISVGLPEATDRMDIHAAAEGNGICGYVAASGRSYIAPDTTRDPRYLPGLDGAGSSLTVPLRLHDQVVGVLNVESTEIAAFSEDDRQFAEIFARYIAIALHILKLLAAERSTTTGQITADVGTELAGPLNDIIAEATSAIDEPAGQDDLHRRLHAIIENVDRVKRTLQALTLTPAVRGLVPDVPSVDPLLSGRRILVADDEDIIRETIADVLAKHGALAVMARDGQEATAMIRAQHFDLVISDIKMPYKNGYEVFASARQANIHCPVILITGFGYDPEHSIVRASREGLAGVLFKPFKVEQLVDLIHRALGVAQAS